jgi:hypothetical protein
MRSLRGDRASPGYRIGGPQPRAALCFYRLLLAFIDDIVSSSCTFADKHRCARLPALNLAERSDERSAATPQHAP